MGSFSSSKNTSIILLVALVATLLFAVYYYLVFPKKSEVEALNNSISLLQTQITTIESSIEQSQAGQQKETTNSFALRKMLPESRELDELLLNIEEIEYVTNSIVTSILFSSYDSSVSESGTIPGTEESGTNEITQDSTGQLIESSQVTEGVQEQGLVSNLTASLPPELKLITFNLEVESPNYDRLLEFIDEIEQLERIMRIDSIDFSLPGEEAEFQEEEPETVSASIQVTTFYYGSE